MKIERIPREAIYARLHKPFNPPLFSCEEERLRFNEEWYAVSDGLRQELDQLGTWDAHASGDYYYLDGNPCESRGIGFEVYSHRMQTPTLISCIRRYLLAVPETYEIYVNNPLGFSMFVGLDYLVFSGTDEEASRFGIE